MRAIMGIFVRLQDFGWKETRYKKRNVYFLIYFSQVDRAITKNKLLVYLNQSLLIDGQLPKYLL